MDHIEARYQKWLSSPVVNGDDKAILMAMTPEQKKDAFFKQSEFGTGGLRSILGPGDNRINLPIVRKITVAFAYNLLSKHPMDAKRRGVVISHDNRHMSREFALKTSEVLNTMGFNTYLFDSLRATPECSFAIRYSRAVGGVMITASHNSKEYNGFKIYDENGCQYVPEKIAPVIELMKTLGDCLDVIVPTAEVRGVQTIYNQDIDDEYCLQVRGIQLNPDLDKKNFKIVYTPQHGASYENAMRVFKDCGYHVYPVTSQSNHDPDFGGTLSPNPENPDAYVEAIKLAKKVGAQIIVSTDPDGDRCGVGYLGKDGEFHLLTGNQSGAMLIDYLFHQRKKKRLLNRNGVLYDTIVTSGFGRDIAAHYGIKCESFLTGFKYIGDRIHYYSAVGNGPRFEFGYEESYGCLIAPFVRDKDGIQAILMYSEMALYYYLHGMDLGDAFEAVQKKYFYYDNFSISLPFPGAEGHKKMTELMEKAHKDNVITELQGVKITSVEDYMKQTKTSNGRVVDTISLPQSDVVKFITKDNNSITIRPSGTEPKVKIYVETKSKKKEGLHEFGEANLKEFLTKMGIKA